MTRYEALQIVIQLGWDALDYGVPANEREYYEQRKALEIVENFNVKEINNLT